MANHLLKAKAKLRRPKRQQREHRANLQLLTQAARDVGSDERSQPQQHINRVSPHEENEEEKLQNME